LVIDTIRWYQKGGLDMKRVVAFLLVLVVSLTFSFGVYADDTSTSKSVSKSQQKIYISIKPDIAVQMNGVKQRFSDANSRAVYPAIYEGSAYLPVRAVAGLMNKSIEWDGSSKTVFIGKTLSDPNGSGNISSEGAEAAKQSSMGVVIPQDVMAYLKPDVLIMYNFVLQTFTDVNGKTVYPIIYNGTTYLPLRGISQMLDKTVQWDSLSKVISINDPEKKDTSKNDQATDTKVTEPAISAAAQSLKSVFEREEMLYYEATLKTTSLKAAATATEKQQIAEKITDNLLSAQKLTAEVTSIDKKQFTSEQLEAYNKTKDFVESTEFYIQILENIAYLAAQDQDYSMLADTFLYYAMDSQTKMETARESLKDLK
jgi:hypothetical protein